jgi:hypothetical protein
LDFCENLLRIENAKTNIKIEKAFRLGKKKMDATKPRPIVVKFGKLEDREMVRSISNRLNNPKQVFTEIQNFISTVFRVFFLSRYTPPLIPLLPPLNPLHPPPVVRPMRKIASSVSNLRINVN